MIEIVCNAQDREELGCNADDGLPCGKCEAELNDEAKYWAGVFRYDRPQSREEYEADMRDAGRGHLVAHE